jgi:hypothetical protein
MDGVGANHVRPGKDANVRRERWEMENGKWKMENGKWKMDD